MNKWKERSQSLLVPVGGWLIGFVAAMWIEFGLVYLAVSMLYFIVRNTGTSSGAVGERKSAYSVFNENCERLQGDIDPTAIDRQIRSGGM